MARESMNAPSPSPAAERLQRLSGYLEQDPTNPVLLADACESAIACGQHEQAEGYIVAAQRLELDRREWMFRRARLCIARRDLDEAAGLLEQLRAEWGPHPILSHDLGYVRLLQGQPQAAFALLQPWMQDAAVAAQWPANHREPMQVLWLRACHRLGLLEEASDWVQQERDAGVLEAAASGVAGLIALDLDDLPAARMLADAALEVDASQLEALVARGSVALAEGDTRGARKWLQAALKHHPHDGRTWSALGMASMMEADFKAAQQHLQRAVQAMPEHVETWHALGWAHLMRGEGEAAASAFRSALELDAQDADTHGALAVVLQLLGDHAKAQHHLEEAERLDAGSVTAACARAVLSGEVRDPGKLEAVMQEALARWKPRP